MNDDSSSTGVKVAELQAPAVARKLKQQTWS